MKNIYKTLLQVQFQIKNLNRRKIKYNYSLLIKNKKRLSSHLIKMNSIKRKKKSLINLIKKIKE